VARPPRAGSGRNQEKNAVALCNGTQILPAGRGEMSSSSLPRKIAMNRVRIERMIREMNAEPAAKFFDRVIGLFYSR